MYCSKCGKPNPDEAAFCAGCGAKLNAGITNEARQTEPETSGGTAPTQDESVGEVLKKFKSNAVKTGSYIKENAVPAAKKTAEFTKGKAQEISKMPFKKLVKRVILIVLAVVLLFGFVSIFQGSDEDKIQKLANNYAEAINDNSVKKLAKCIDPEKREMFTEQINKSAEFWDWANLKDMVNVPESKELRIGVTNIVIEGNTATADFAYYFDSSKMWTESVDLIKVKSKWYFAEM